MKMNPEKFAKSADISLGMQLIISGMVTLVEDEGYTPRQVLEIVESTKDNVFHALMELKEDNK